MEQLQELVLERVRHHIAGYLEPGKPGQELASFPRKNRNRAKRTELERLQGEIVRRRKREVKVLNRELACLLIEKVVIYPIDATENTRKIEIDWKF